ncbi:unnamed protein product (macronuclear) [Paramecium tetraurelia]|uniref:Arrestin C-terminal-like domain-containing protein n=1 Tax=Paramecium tetraurelia TaxID=5888 RepID=A0DQK5_PARTE|nr:uncharacterized protein GSPATT00002722001 [Paramecium tetraurelia]CAK85322.1 unnamed protein product [Paramecium tetraurelia]|eukprot:XP_001452719.1 hypothetical protein (macronuclear) [Paramecium tetraurelia strain d4-2]
MIYTLTPSQAQISIKIDKPAYYPGEIIKGVIYMKIKTNDIDAGLMYLKVRMLIELIQLCCQEKVNQLDSYNQFFSFKQFIYKKLKKITDFGKKMPMIACKKYFELEVPSLYPSFTINYYKTVQCRVLYFLTINLQNQDGQLQYKVPKKHRVVVHVLEKLPIINQIPIEIERISKAHKRLCFSTEKTKIKIQLQKIQNIFGDNIPLILSVDNMQSNIGIQKFEIRISSQLVVLYKEQKRKLSNYFEIFKLEINEQIKSHQNKQISLNLILPIGNEANQTSFFPQSTIKTKRISYQYILTVNVIFDKFLFYKVDNLVISAPLILIQNKKREKTNIIQSMENLSRIGQMGEPSSRLNMSQLNNFIYGDHNFAGYGEQDGYKGPERKYNPVESLDELALKDIKGALEELMGKKEDEEDSEIDENFLEEIVGASKNTISMNQISLFEQQKQRTIFKQNQKYNSDFSNLNNEEFKQDYCNQINLHTIKEEQDSSGTQYNLNNAKYNSQIRKHDQINEYQRDLKDNSKIEQLESFNNQQDKINFDYISNNQNFPTDPQNNKRQKNNNKNPITSKETDQKPLSKFKGQFNDQTQISSPRNKMREKISLQNQKN